jgi:hypothetical protein
MDWRRAKGRAFTQLPEDDSLLRKSIEEPQIGSNELRGLKTGPIRAKERVRSGSAGEFFNKLRGPYSIT